MRCRPTRRCETPAPATDEPARRRARSRGADRRRSTRRRRRTPPRGRDESARRRRRTATNSTRGPLSPSQERSSSTSPHPYATIVCEPAERLSEESLRDSPSELREPFGKPDRGVDDRRLHPPVASEHSERDADRVDSREDDVGAIRRRRASPAPRRSRPSTRLRGAPRGRRCGLSYVYSRRARSQVRGCAAPRSPRREARRARTGCSARDPRPAPAARRGAGPSRGRGRRRSPRLG